MPEVRFHDTPTGPVLENAALRLAVSLDEGAFSLGRAGNGDEIIPAAWTGVELADGASLTSRGAGFDFAGVQPVEDAHGPGTAVTLRRRAAAGEPRLALTLTLYEEQPFAVLRSRLTNTTGRPLRVQAFHVLQANLRAPQTSPGGWRFYRNGWQSWSPTMTLSLDEGDIPSFPPILDPATRPQGQGNLVSDLVATVTNSASGHSVTAGFLSTADQFSQVW
ncbi:MAG: hypothetical protein V3S20_08260, partial [Dehalococcoidia bacterium]